jgi:hypothetical protein
MIEILIRRGYSFEDEGFLGDIYWEEENGDATKKDPVPLYKKLANAVKEHMETRPGATWSYLARKYGTSLYTIRCAHAWAVRGDNANKRTDSRPYIAPSNKPNKYGEV